MRENGGSMSEDNARKRRLNVGGLCEEKGTQCRKIMRRKGDSMSEDYATNRGLNVAG